MNGKRRMKGAGMNVEGKEKTTIAADISTRRATTLHSIPAHHEPVVQIRVLPVVVGVVVGSPDCLYGPVSRVGGGSGYE